MTSTLSAKFRARAAIALCGIVAACGGGGGGGLPEPTINLNITLQNQDEVARASFGSSVSSAVGGFTGAGASGRTSPLATKRAQSVAALALRKRIAADVSADLCPGGGAASAAETDTAPVGQVNVGDGARITFVSCDDGAGSVASGVMLLTITQLGDSSLSFAITTSDFSVLDTATGYTASLDGTFGLTLSGNDAAFTTRMTVGDELQLVADVGSLSDTVTLLNGYTAVATYTPADFTTTATAAGAIDSAAAGGTFRVSTPQPLVQTDSEDYPHAGQLIAQGVASRMRATVISNTQVLLEVDTNGDGAYDQSSIVGWTTLLGAPN